MLRIRDRRPRLTYANVMSTAAVFVTLGGSATAAVIITGKQVKNGSLTAADLHRSTLTGKQIKDHSLTAADLAKGLTLGTGDGGTAGAGGAAGSPGAKDDPGAKGEPGTPGAQGILGAPGAKGDKGDPGTANVIASNWAVASHFVQDTYDNTLANTAVVDAPELTAPVLAHASVMVYATFGSAPFPLPYRSNAGSTFNTISYTLAPGAITIRRSTDGCTTSACLIVLSASLQYRYVIIPAAS